MTKPVVYFGGQDMRSPEEILQDDIDEMAEYLNRELDREEADKQGYYDSKGHWTK